MNLIKIWRKNYKLLMVLINKLGNYKDSDDSKKNIEAIDID